MKNSIVAVIGAGTMGSGIAHTFAQYGYKTHLVDVSEKELNSALGLIDYNLSRMVTKETITEKHKKESLTRIKTFTDIHKAVEKASIVIEAVSEDLDLKAEVFHTLDKSVSDSCILASNTSAISITKLASVTKNPHRVIGMHFMNPVPIMPLVEIIKGLATSKDTLNQTLAFVKDLEKTPVESEDYPGFISNRILIPMINEAIYALYEGVAPADNIDSVMKLGMSHPMGPLELADFIGLDVVHSIAMVLYEGFGSDKYFPCPLLTKMVNAGKLGRKSGEGFYSYPKS